MATPQCGTAQLGSLAATPRNSFSAAEYANEYKSATARSKLFCALLEHEVGNWTLPSFSGTGCSCSGTAASDCQSPHTSKTKQTRSASIARVIRFRGVGTLIIMYLLWTIQSLIARDNLATDHCHSDFFDLPSSQRDESAVADLTGSQSSAVIGCCTRIFEST